jgi:hypothetical protein
MKRRVSLPSFSGNWKTLTRVPQLEEKAKKVSEERRFFAEGAYEGNASFRAM